MSFIWSPLLGAAAASGIGATGAATLPQFTGTGSATWGFLASGAGTLPSFTGAATANAGYTLTGAATLPMLRVEGLISPWIPRVSPSAAAAWTDRPDPAAPTWTERPDPAAPTWDLRVEPDPTTTWTDRN